MNYIQALGLAGILGLTGCTTVTEQDFNRLSSKQLQQLHAAHQYSNTNKVEKLPLIVRTPEHLLSYVDFPQASYTFHALPAADTTNNAYWKGRVDTTTPALNQSIPVLEKIAQELPKGGRVSRLAFPDHYALIGQKSGVRAIEFYHTGTNDALAINIQRTTGIKSGKDHEHYQFSVTSGVPSTKITSRDRNYLALINTAEATGIGMAILPLEGRVFGAGQAVREAMFYWNTRNPIVTKTKVYTFSDLSQQNARVRTITETARTLNADTLYLHHTPAGTLLIYGQDTKRPLTGKNKEAGIPAHTLQAEREEVIRSHCGALFWRALEVGAGAGTLKVFPQEKKVIQTFPTTPPTGVSGGSIGAPGGR